MIVVNPTIIWWGNTLYHSNMTSERSPCIYTASTPRILFSLLFIPPHEYSWSLTYSLLFFRSVSQVAGIAETGNNITVSIYLVINDTDPQFDIVG